jgi:hypothetical protein
MIQTKKDSYINRAQEIIASIGTAKPEYVGTDAVGRRIYIEIATNSLFEEDSDGGFKKIKVNDQRPANEYALKELLE